MNEILYKRAQQNRVVSGLKFMGDKALFFLSNKPTRKSDAHDFPDLMTEVRCYVSGF
jgi:hypothetical protein